jgi:hypothetical protein
MHKQKLIVIAALMFGSSLGSLAFAQGDQKTDGLSSACCQVVRAALQSASNIHAGMRRSDVEKDSVKDGGVTFRQDTTYTYRECHYIKIHVSFVPDESGEINDVVQQRSAPYIAYETRD